MVGASGCTQEARCRQLEAAYPKSSKVGLPGIPKLRTSALWLEKLSWAPAPPSISGNFTRDSCLGFPAVLTYC